MKRANKKPIADITLDINTLSHDGRGLAHVSGKATFIHGAMAGEKVLCRITRQHRRYNEGSVIELLSAASPDRATPHCLHYGVCGGCSLQHMQIDSQIQLKQHTLLEQLKHFGNVTPQFVLPHISGTPWGYRGKARLGVRYVKKKEKVLVGFREKFSHYLADIHSCPVLHPSVGKHISALSELIARLTQFEHVPQIEVAVGEDGTAFIFRHITALPDEDVTELCEFGKLHSFQIYLQPNSPENIHKIWPKDGVEKLKYRLLDYDLEMQFHPLDFTQVNSEINPLMIQQALHLLDLQSSDHVLDLFCGLGNFTLPIARFAKQVTGVEGSEAMVLRAQENAQFNKIHNAEFYAADLMKLTHQGTWMQQTYHKILLDPPRTGAKEIIPYLKQFSANTIVYVSCNPATLARDAGVLVHEMGYQLKKVGVINMFPHTSHIEAIALFVK